MDGLGDRPPDLPSRQVALVLLGTSEAMTVFAPLQPAIGAASLVLLAGTVAWRFRLRA